MIKKINVFLAFLTMEFTGPTLFSNSFVQIVINKVLKRFCKFTICILYYMNLASFLALKSPGSKVRPNISYSLFEELVSWCAQERRSWRCPCEFVRVAFSKTCIVFTARLNLTSGYKKIKTYHYLTN